MTIMRMLFVLIAAGAVTLWGHEPAGAEDREPTDRYAEIFAGKTLTDGRGFVGQLEIGAPLPVVVPLLGWGRQEAMVWPFWYFFEKGSWKLTVVARPDYERCNFLHQVEALILEGKDAPATSRGIRIGDPVAKVEAQYGADPGKLDELLDSRGVTKTTWRNPNSEPPDMTERKAFDRSVELGHYYPQHGMLFTFDDGKVSRIIALFEYDPTALWLRDRPDDPREWIAVIKDGIERPTWEHPDAEGQQGLLFLPEPPAVEPAQVDGITVGVPKGWRRDGRTWASPQGAEQVTLSVTEADEDVDVDTWFDEQKAEAPRIMTVRAQQTVPPSVCDRMGADAARTWHYQLPDAGIDGWPARVYVLLAAKGSKRYRITVSRTVWQRNPGPDGIELARRVFTSVRLAP